ncbi:MAG: hypothetical protein QOI99_2216, partial [Actinomycetota bacterium]|nr:hypothetical protein [Actinomycetota bacterium]
GGVVGQCGPAPRWGGGGAAGGGAGAGGPVASGGLGSMAAAGNQYFGIHDYLWTFPSLAVVTGRRR